MMLSFTIHPHKNVLCNHKTTIEFTKDDELTLRGDCILGVRANFDLKELKKIKGTFKVTITCGGLQDHFVAYAVDSFDSDHEIVIRKTDFISPRTFGIKANKAAVDIDRNLVEALKERSATVKIKKVKIKALIFDLDDTLSTWKEIAREKGHKALAKKASELYDIDSKRFLEVFNKVDAEQLATAKAPEDYSRELWAKKALDILKIKHKKPELLELERVFHNETLRHVKLFPDTEEILKKLKKDFKIVIFSESDGKKEFKIKRIKHLEIDHLIDLIVTTDDTKILKPDKKNILFICEKLDVLPEECVMIGDHPEKDLITAKEIGMTTILLKNGNSKSMKDYKYVDFEIESIRELSDVLKRI